MTASPTTKVTLTFCGGTGSVTGANFLLEISSPKDPKAKPFKVLVDCGLEQGSEAAHKFNAMPFPYDPASVDALLVTHAHADHIGRIPKLVKDGFRGVIYSTPATRDLTEVMFADALHLLTREAQEHQQPVLYAQEDVQKALSLWHTIPYYSLMDIGSCISVYAKDAGHILGSAMYELHIGTNVCPTIGAFPIGASKTAPEKTKKYGELVVTFTGDLGNSPALFLRDTDSIAGADYLVMESVYGDRNHESKDDRRKELTAVINDTANRKRTLLIPAFSLERTQDILFELHELQAAGKIPALPVYVDSPLAEKVTDIYRRYSADFKPEAREMMKAKGADLFAVPKLSIAQSSKDSARLDQLPSPKIILAGSGMSVGGRIVSHEHHVLPDPNTTLLLVGYQSVGTLGRALQDGAKEVHLSGDSVQVRAEVKTILGYSSHKDSDHLVEFVSAAPSLKKVFVVMGEPKAALFLAQRLHDYLGISATSPAQGDTVELL